jgi:DNA-binding transcriptional MerR regulator
MAKSKTKRPLLPKNQLVDTHWSGPQVAKILGIPYDTLHYWVKLGLVTPNIPAIQRRHKSLYSFVDLVAISALKALREQGLSLRKLKRAKAELWDRVGMSFEQGLHGGVIVADGQELFAVLYSFDEAVQIMSLLKGGQMVLPLDQLVAEVQERSEQMFGARELQELPEVRVTNEH